MWLISFIYVKKITSHSYPQHSANMLHSLKIIYITIKRQRILPSHFATPTCAYKSIFCVAFDNLLIVLCIAYYKGTRQDSRMFCSRSEDPDGCEDVQWGIGDLGAIPLERVFFCLVVCLVPTIVVNSVPSNTIP